MQNLKKILKILVEDLGDKMRLPVKGYLVLGVIEILGIASILRIKYAGKMLHIIFSWLFKSWGILKVPAVYFVLLGAAATIGKKRQSPIFSDSGNMSMAKSGTYGTAKWMSPREVRKKMVVALPEECKGILLGAQKPKGNVVCIPEKCDYLSNKNVCIFGGSGMGKSRGFIGNNLLQAMMRGESVIVTDPKGELRYKYAALFEMKGYRVKSLDLKDPRNGDGFDLLGECINSESGDVDLNRVNTFVATFINNTNAGERADAESFWESGEHTMLSGLVLYLFALYDNARNQALEQILENIDGYADAGIKLIGRTTNEKIQCVEDAYVLHGPNPLLLESMEIANRENGNIFAMGTTREQRTKQFHALLEQKLDANTQPTMRELYRIVNEYNFDKMNEELDFLVEESGGGNSLAIEAKNKLSSRCQKPDNRGNFMMGLVTRFSRLMSPDLQRIISCDDIDLTLPSKQKCAYFCVLPEIDTSVRSISALFFTFTFIRCMDYADKSNGKNVPINFFLDEFANIGKIPNIEQLMSTCRSRKMAVTIVLQAISQLYDLYGNQRANTLIANCATQIFLGGNDYDTCQYFSELLGKTTIETYGVNSYRDNATSVSQGEAARLLMEPDEIRKMEKDRQIIICGNLPPMLLYKYWVDKRLETWKEVLKQSTRGEVVEVEVVEEQIDEPSPVTIIDRHRDEPIPVITIDDEET